MEGMVSICELSINVVMSNKPKMLTGLSQKALERVQGLDNILSWTPNAPGGERAPHPFGGNLAERGKPVLPLPREVGKPSGQPKAVRVEGWEKAKAAL